MPKKILMVDLLTYQHENQKVVIFLEIIGISMIVNQILEKNSSPKLTKLEEKKLYS